MNTCKNFVDSIKNADFTGIFRLIMKEPSYIYIYIYIYVYYLDNLTLMTYLQVTKNVILIQQVKKKNWSSFAQNVNTKLLE